MGGTLADDRRHVWHPFTPFSVWMDPHYEPTAIASGKGCFLKDARGREYFDGNSSIWVNLHGHRHPRIDRAIRAQLRKIAHSSFLGLTNEPAPLLARRLVEFSLPGGADPAEFPSRVFFSDDGSTAIEAAIKIVVQYFSMAGQGGRHKFVSLSRGYHGDTVGAMSVGHSDGFHGHFKKLSFGSQEAMSPHCYRCPYNTAPAQKGSDARRSRKCGFECVREFQKAVDACGDSFAGAVVEPIVQGAAGMAMHPPGYLAAISEYTRRAGGKLILDEVMTAFHRTGPRMAFHAEDCRPDVLCLAKGLTGGYLPLAATIVTDELVQGFLGGPEKTFYHGHSYSGNQLGSAAALENLAILSGPAFPARLQKKIRLLERVSAEFWKCPHVGDVRQSGMVLAVEIVEDPATKKPFDPALRTGWEICERAKRHGLLTRPVGDVLVLMPPLSATGPQLRSAVDMLCRAIRAHFGK
jgi:adenosylmethionine-8-amino-7-oxononanoate aminotransferase